MRVLVVDDSAVVRGAVGRLLDAEPDLAVVGTAINGRQALEALATRPADVVVLDVEMPEMDGLTALALIRRRHPGTRVLMLSALGGRGAGVTLRALALGAADFVCKPQAGAAAPGAAPLADLPGKVRALGRGAWGSAGGRSPAPAPAVPGAAARPTTPSAAAPARAPATGAPVRRPSPPRPMRVLVVAASTGGPVALSSFFGALPRRLDVPVLVTQHMPPDFTRLLAEQLTASSGHACAEARNGERLVAGRVYVAPGDYHLLLERRGRDVQVRLTQDPPVNHCRPAADPMFASAAAAYGPDVLGVVLTGMGHDGREGAGAIVRAGGRVLAQDEATSVVWGMPGAVAQAGLAESVLPIPQLATYVAACCAARATAS